MKQLKLYFYRYQGLSVAYQIYAYSKKDAIKKWKEQNQAKRLPNYFEVWL